ncbi:adenosylcobinamide-GDP ribazoletransferase [Roseibium suaedae]|uniref:Adenosylcobinamide-GDP ribazoletransferase n=1 Tax=Roseibium suaedae TaxID=735517 RepID=A0A1M7CND3_9HYPH|nr:adenosylcobinamide-GDP ribazoletransferase [Roseibium suaedae]SHL68808.1 cobalamin-5'-phosphate synthase [Roseibium suaedae]
MTFQDEPGEGQEPSLPQRILCDTAACLRFFSRLPLPRLSACDNPAALPDFSAIAWAIPIAGVLIALPAALAGVLLGYTGLPALAVGLIVTGLLAAVTGALHEDGLADIADGFFGGATAERRLAIMKDSQIGSFGALALIVSVGLKAVLIATLLERLGPVSAMVLVLGSEALSRCLMAWQWSVLPAARPEGLGHRFGCPDQAAVVLAAVATLVLLIPSASLLPVPALLVALVLSAGAAFAVGRLAIAKIGGFTGDVLGAVQQVSGLVFLICITG